MICISPCVYVNVVKYVCDIQVRLLIYALSGGINYIYDYVIVIGVPPCVVYEIHVCYVLCIHKMNSVINHKYMRKYFITHKPCNMRELEI